MAKKRKLSDLTSQETEMFLSMINKFKNDLAEDDEEEKSFIGALEHVMVKLQAVNHVPFSSVDATTFIKAKIKPGPLTLRLDKLDELEALGRQEGTDPNRLSYAITKQFIELIRAHVSYATEAGCRILVNAILLHIVSNLSGRDIDVGIIPEFRMPATKFEEANLSFGGVVDYLIIKCPKGMTEFILDEPTVAFANPDMVKAISSNIYEAKKDGVRAAVPQAAIAAASYCRSHKLSTFRGCVTSGESWVFFVYNEIAGGEGGSCSISKEIKIDSDERLAQIIGLLKDWIIHSREYEQNFFTYLEFPVDVPASVHT